MSRNKGPKRPVPHLSGGTERENTRGWGASLSVISSETPRVGRTHNERSLVSCTTSKFEPRTRCVLTKILNAAPLSIGWMQACTRERTPGEMHTTNIIISPRVEDLAVARPQAPQHLPQGLRGGVVEALEALVERNRIVVEQSLVGWNQRATGSRVIKQGICAPAGGRASLPKSFRRGLRSVVANSIP